MAVGNPNADMNRGMFDASGYQGFDWAMQPDVQQGYLWDTRLCGLAPELSVSWNGGQLKHGQVITFESIGRPSLLCYDKNMRLEYQNVEVDDVSFVMGMAWYWAEKIDKLDYECFTRLPEYRRAELQQLYEEVTIKQEQIVRFRRFMSADCKNRGTTSKGYFWGTSCENPRYVTCNDIDQLLAEIKLQLRAYCPKPNDPIQFPYPCEFEMALMMSPRLQQQMAATNCVQNCAIKEGTYLQRIMGVDLYESHYTHSEVNSKGEEVFFIDVGAKSATIFADGISCLEMDREHPDYFGAISRFLVCFDAETIHPERVGALYVVFDPLCTPCDPCSD